MSENGNVVYISTDFGHKNTDGDRNILLEGQKTEIANIILQTDEYFKSNNYSK